MNNVREVILDILLRMDKDGAYSHLVIDNKLKSGKVDPKDEGLLTEIVYGTIQRKMTLDFYLDTFVHSKKKIAPWAWMLLRMSVYQIVYLSKVPDHAIINEAVEIAKKRGHKGVASLVNGVLRSIQRQGVPDTATLTDTVDRIAVETSHPVWLVKRWISMYGQALTQQMCEANVSHKPSAIRIQPLKLSRQEAIRRLTEQCLEVRPSVFSEQGIIVDKGNILKTELFSSGLVTVQDQSSMLVGEMIDAKPGMDVLEACSAPGGKATHMAEKMQNQGKLYAYDLHKKKANLVNQKALELGLSIIRANQADARQLGTQHAAESFDRILVDAPCSGLGVIRGKPEIKYNKTLADIERLATIQLEILESVAPLLKKDGKLIYSTCTVDQTENEGVVQAFLHQNPNFAIDDSFFAELPEPLKQSPGITRYGLQIFPQSFQTDGFFLTRLRKAEVSG
ncbi:16S rRNA (cytosine(967)-C(5))-methyltransferase RsmB [Lentibacillus sp. L22]|uniref:16S rRNA (cytosine(967)-C(5))-methyltransferase RsmB n=1 Tax=Lentibacillus TaxID=175304 RepID=UPI0022B122B0|nr:16S rRNA (cytosine(967)-C(5))-methyltransferase RsmB [Lentibacillus daqui]